MINKRIIIHFTGYSYYFCLESGKQLSKSYKKLNNLRKYGKLNTNN